jgi:pimeloyl-ACP methyl ester carboxylesterase
MNSKSIAFAAAVLLLLSGCQTPRQPDYPETESLSASDGVEIHYRTSGVGNFTLVMVHDWCCDMTYWKHQVPAFSSGYKTVTMDLAGHGRSGSNRTDWTISAFADDVAKVVRRTGGQNVILIGHGLGGPVILEAASLIPERVIGLVGVDTFKDHFMQSYSSRQIEYILQPWQKDFQLRMREYVLETLFPDHVDEELKKKILLDMLDYEPYPALDILRSWLRYDGSRGFGAVEDPIHAINSKLRPATYQVAEKHAESFSYIYQSQAGHFPMLENPDFFNRILVGILEEIIMDMYQQR